MGMPMPVHSRFAVGTEWVLTLPQQVGIKVYTAGTRVRVEELPGPSAYEDELVVKVSFPDEEVAFVPLSILS